MAQNCHKRKPKQPTPRTTTRPTWADIVTNETNYNTQTTDTTPLPNILHTDIEQTIALQNDQQKYRNTNIPILPPAEIVMTNNTTEEGNTLSNDNIIATYVADRMDIEDLHTPDEDINPIPQQTSTDDITIPTPNTATADSPSRPQHADVKEASASNVSDINNKPRLSTGSRGKRDQLYRSREDFATLIIPTNDDPEVSRLHYLRKKTPEQTLKYPKKKKRLQTHTQ